MTINERIRKFNTDRGLLTGFDVELECNMIAEELLELGDAKSWDDQVDALCDIIVVATGALHKMEVNPDACMDETLKEIESRTGVLGADGKWYKEITGNEYKACYRKSVVR